MKSILALLFAMGKEYRRISVRTMCGQVELLRCLLHHRPTCVLRLQSGHGLLGALNHSMKSELARSEALTQDALRP